MRRSWIVLALLCAGCRGTKHEYPPDVRAAFVEQCAAHAPRRACECTLDELQYRLTYEEYTALEAEARTSQKPPMAFQDAANACR